MKTNVEIIQEYVEQVFNQKRIDLWDQYISEDYVSRGSPYVGVGFGVDSSGGKVIINSIAPGSPAEAKVQLGDELIWAEDESGRFETYEALKTAVLMGYRGSTFKIGVRRGDQSLDFEFTRGMIEGFDISKPVAKSYLQQFLLKDYPDAKGTVKHILSQGDMVACLLEWRGTNADFDREAIWSEAWFVRLAEGKIVEEWYVSGDVSHLKQLGYQILAPGT